MERNTVIQDLKKIIEEQNNIVVESREQELAIDSFTIILILTLAQEKLEMELDLEKLDFENFENLAAIEDVLFSGNYLVEKAAPPSGE